MRCIGLMSGTSVDAVDAALCRIERGRVVAVEAVYRHEYEASLRERLLAVQQAPDTPLSLRGLAALDHGIAEAFANAALGVLGAGGRGSADIGAIGSHGQTVLHDPSLGNTLQLGDPSLIAARTGIAVVADFRRADIARGGQGAPLVPLFHRTCFGRFAPCAVLNLGGIANLTVLSGDGAVTGFDTGPANGLMDAWIERAQQRRYDADGRWAANGKIDDELLRACLADPYFARPPPKSTGRDHFNLGWLERRFARVSTLPAADVQRSLCALSARSIAMQLQRFAPQASRLIVCGGGRLNPLLMGDLRAALPGVRVQTTEEAAGIDGGVIEAAAFAWLAWRRIRKLPGSLPSVTGAARPAILGGLYLP
ncbi:MAG: anhydro-N-acetylmuramic acid kinase [Pseudomonadota bacterium]